jgi:hypothetical protein
MEKFSNFNDKSKTNKPKEAKAKPAKAPEKVQESTSEEDLKVQLIGKIAKFPKSVKVSKAYNFLENIKIPKNRIWYLLVENQDNELQMVKYNVQKGVNLNQFMNDLKSYYISKFKEAPNLKKVMESITVEGDAEGKFSVIKNIPKIELSGKKLVTRITEDLIKLLAK